MMVLNLTNATGWSSLIGGNVTRAVWEVFDTPLRTPGAEVGYLILLLTVAVLAAIYIKTNNAALTFGVGLMFSVGFSVWIPSVTGFIFTGMNALFLAGTIYYTFWKSR